MEKIMHLKNLGDLKLYKVLDVIDYARLFVCTSDSDDYYLFVELETNLDFEKWVAVRLTEERLFLLLSNNMSVQKAFVNKDSNTYFIITHFFDDDEYVWEETRRMPENVFGDDEFYVGITEIENERLVDDTFKAFEKRMMPTLDVHFNPYSNNHSLPVGFFTNFLESFKKIFNKITNSRRDCLSVEPIRSSFLIRFQSTVPDSLVEENTSENAFKTISKVLTAKSVDDISDEFIQNPEILNSSKELVSCIAKEKRNFDVIFAFSNEQKPIIENVKSERIVSLSNQLKNYFVSEESIDDYEGTLDGYDTIRKIFSFTTKNGTIFKGKLDKEFSLKQYKVPNDYKVTIKTFKVTGGENLKEKLNFYLVNIVSED